MGFININNIDKFIEEHEVAAGTFKGLHVGNTFDILYDGVKKTIIIAGFDYKYKPGKKHNILCIPLDDLCDAPIIKNEYSPYAKSYMHTEAIPKINKKLENVFGDHLLSSEELLEDKNGLKKYICKAVLMSEGEVFGKAIYGNDDKSKQLPLFKILDKFWAKPWYWAWLRNQNKESSSNFCNCNNFGNASYGSASYVGGVRPRFLLG